VCDEARDRGNVAAVSYVGLVEAIDEQVDVIEVASGPRSLEASTMALRERVVVVAGHRAWEYDAAGRTGVAWQPVGEEGMGKNDAFQTTGYALQVSPLSTPDSTTFSARSPSSNQRRCRRA
jgi:hypothetical protein